MGKIDDACREVVARVEGAMAAGVVDLHTGMLLGASVGVSLPAPSNPALNELVAGATMDLFRGGDIARIAQRVRPPDEPEDGRQEVHITSADGFHFLKTLGGGKAVLILVTHKTTNIGMGWAQLKALVPTVEPLVP